MTERMRTGDLSQSEDRPLVGVGLMCITTFCFACMAACVKWLSSDLTVVQVVWGRLFFHTVLIFLLFPRRIPSLLVSRRKDVQILRSILLLMATICSFTALRYLPLTSLVALSFVGPLLVVALAAVFLHERVGFARWVAVCIGFGGVLVILRPGLGVAHWASVFALGLAFFYAIYQIITRVVRGIAPPLTSLLYASLVGTFVTSIAVPFFWVTPDPVHWLVMAASGFFGGAGHLAVIKAYESAPASVVAPFSYLELLWAAVLGWILFAHFPDGWTLVGAAIIIGTGLYLFHTQSSKQG